MKKILIFQIFLVFSCIFVNAQKSSVYFEKDGFVLHKITVTDTPVLNYKDYPYLSLKQLENIHKVKPTADTVFFLKYKPFPIGPFFVEKRMKIQQYFNSVTPVKGDLNQVSSEKNAPNGWIIEDFVLNTLFFSTIISLIFWIVIFYILVKKERKKKLVVNFSNAREELLAMGIVFSILFGRYIFWNIWEFIHPTMKPFKMDWLLDIFPIVFWAYLFFVFFVLFIFIPIIKKRFK